MYLTCLCLLPNLHSNKLVARNYSPNAPQRIKISARTTETDILHGAGAFSCKDYICVHMFSLSLFLPGQLAGNISVGGSAALICCYLQTVHTHETPTSYVMVVLAGVMLVISHWQRSNLSLSDCAGSSFLLVLMLVSWVI